MRVLVACEESQEVCKAFRAKGHEAYSCDIQECSGGHPEWHIQCDALIVMSSVKILGKCGGIHFQTCDKNYHFVDKWDMIIVHPPCTYMSKAGTRWMFPKAGEIDWDRYALAMEAKDFFMAFYNCECEKVVIENPVPLKCVELPKPTQKIQPYEFDDKNEHPYSKATLLWIKGVPKLRPTTPRNKPIGTWMPSNTGGFSRGQGGGRGIAHDKKTASKTFSGIARAMAEQWG